MSQLVKKVIVNSKKDFNKEELPMIEIIDAPCGRGKTSYAINKINSSEDKVVYVTPFLSEVDRMTKECKRLCSPDTKESDTKVEDFVRLLKEGKSIATTHSLFKGFNDDCYRLIKENGYSLIFDEVITTVKTYGITVDDINMLEGMNKIKVIGDSKEIIWIAPEYNGQFNVFKKAVEKGSIYMVKISDKEKYVIAWELPLEKFVNFKDITILTYLFEGSEMSCYFKMNGIPYTLYSLVDYKKVPYDKHTENREALKALINVYDGKANKNFGDSKTALSVNWYKSKKNKNAVKQLNKNTANYFKNIVKSSTKDLLWTCYTEDIDRLDNNYCTSKNWDVKDTKKKTFLSFNTRATNDFRDRHNLAYMVNPFVNPIVAQYFSYKGDVVLDNDLYAVSNLIQWICRSAVREGKPVNLYLPSQRMRDLLNKFFNYEI